MLISETWNPEQCRAPANEEASRHEVRLPFGHAKQVKLLPPVMQCVWITVIDLVICDCGIVSADEFGGALIASDPLAAN